MYTIFKHGKFNRPKKGRCLLKKHTHTIDIHVKKEEEEEPNKVTEREREYNKQHWKEEEGEMMIIKQAHSRERETDDRRNDQISIFMWIYIYIWVSKQWNHRLIRFLSSLVKLKLSIFQKLVFEHKIVPFTRLPAFVIEEDISSLEEDRLHRDEVFIRRATCS